MEQRLRLVLFFFLICFFSVFVKLFFWQIVEGKRLSGLALQQYYTKLEIPAERGKIFANDNTPLVINQNSYLLYLNPRQIELSFTELKEKLKDAVSLPEVDLQNLSKKRVVWYPLAKNLEEESKNKIEVLAIKGLGFEESEKRFYPEASMSAHLLGFVGEDSEGMRKGYFGLEGFYENELRGKSGSRYFEQDAMGRPIPLVEETKEKTLPGRNLFLNIDRKIQFLAEKHLKEGIKKYGAISGSVLVMDPESGAVLAMATFPSYDPSEYYKFNQDIFNNSVISSVFEPGSIFKVAVMASGLDSGKVKVNDICTNCSEPRKIYEYSIKTWNDKYYPNSTMTDIIVHSDNVGMVYVAEKMGLDKFLDYLKRFGFYEATGIDLQGEMVPVIRERKNWAEVDLATASFGQGIALTQIQFLNAVNAIANGGKLYQPQVVKKIFEEDKSIVIEPVLKARPISEKTAKEVTKMMVEAVEKGEAKWAKPEGYKIAGKTGTAQIPIKGHYDPEKTITSFVGFAPADNPKFSMLLTLREPKTSPWGSETAAPLWFEIAKDIFRVWQIKTDD
ncbi:penicillin-binding protein 2 [Patescibacteria group bacterium]|nr:penicillin-binding protein 2 [Patescibacteria group bacterium]